MANKFYIENQLKCWACFALDCRGVTIFNVLIRFITAMAIIERSALLVIFYILVDIILLIILIYLGFILKNLLFYILLAICVLIPALIKLYYSYLNYPLYVHIFDQNLNFKCKKNERIIYWNEINEIRKSILWGINIRLKDGNSIYYDLDNDIIDMIFEVFNKKKKNISYN